MQIYVRDENRTHNYEERSISLTPRRPLAAFARVEGGAPAHPPEAEKCKNCDFKRDCPIRHSRAASDGAGAAQESFRFL